MLLLTKYPKDTCIMKQSPGKDVNWAKEFHCSRKYLILHRVTAYYCCLYKTMAVMQKEKLKQNKLAIDTWSMRTVVRAKASKTKLKAGQETFW